MANFFKYKSLSGTSLRYFIQTLLDEKIYASTFDQLNDPMEGAFLSDEILSAEIKQHIKGTKLEKRIVSLVEKKMMNYLQTCLCGAIIQMSIKGVV